VETVRGVAPFTVVVDVLASMPGYFEYVLT
jgi:hypothetical protein